MSLDMAASPHKCTPCVVPMHVCMCRTKHLLSLLACSLCCAMYTISVFSLDLWEGKVLCIRPSLAMGIHRGTHKLGHTIRVCKGGGGGGERKTKLYACSYTYIEPCAVVEICRSYTCKLF